MSSLVKEDVEVVSPEGRTSTVLRSNALGLTALFFCIATAAAPMTALLFNTPVVVLGSGWAGPSAFLVATVMLLIFTVGYIEMSHRVTTAGGFYSFVSHGFGQVFGLGTAALVTMSYSVLVAALLGVFAYFANTTIDSWLHVSIPVWVLMPFALIIDVLFAWFDIKITALILGVFFIAEVLGALILGFAITFAGGAHGLTAAPLNPLKLFNNHSAIKVFGAAAPGVALFGAFWSWVGFEMAPNYGEESRQPRRIAGVATFATLFVLGIVYVFVTWAFVVGWGTNHVSQAVNAQFKGTYISAYYPLTGRYVGVSLTDAFKILIITSSFACQLAFFNTSARYVFALGRERLLPSALGRTHRKHNTPHIAAITLAVVVGIYVAVFTVQDSSPLGALTKLGTYSPLLGVLGILAAQALTSFAIVRYFWTVERAHFHPWKTLVAPLLGGGLMVFSCFLLLKNRETLAGVNNVFVEAIPWIALAIFVLGVGAALWFRTRDTARYEAVGRFVHEEA
ncbi:MAG: APC family permease [Solirubrobacteraceae bacterium]